MYICVLRCSVYAIPGGFKLPRSDLATVVCWVAVSLMAENWDWYVLSVAVLQ